MQDIDHGFSLGTRPFNKWVKGIERGFSTGKKVKITILPPLEKPKERFKFNGYLFEISGEWTFRNAPGLPMWGIPPERSL